ncbi:ubiquinol-cytochrome-c reductase complex assembly factor 2 isoform X2 [Coccinella septempunctata]|uniref:ubiquinol-cytochrome-c reductase complex assembly factor 2 isoform X2 n=1 Tax=Coccinella septempunctata TaxID=41139 RepID=UPI001D0940F3|nr:ubiquinol-cytochrome-c reductase complex assembly factor 2 isoform X2 [Coccinella septempunctata]
MRPRDLGQFLREKVNKAYKTNQFEADIKHWDKQYLSLQKLVNNEYCRRYPRSATSSATGLTREQCQIALSNEFLEEINEEKGSFLRRLFSFKSNEKN